MPLFMVNTSQKLASQGVVLMVVVIFLQVLSVLSLWLLQSHVWDKRMTQQYWLRYELATTVKMLTTTLLQQPNWMLAPCRITAVSPALVVTQSQAWWQARSCTGNFQSFQYYYVIEFLGEDACAIDSHGANASYYRLTVLLMPTATISQRYVLQTVSALPIHSTQMCMHSQHLVQLGKQQWRELM